jgi:RimJ/RimL family protein N-acetyltransferase
VTDKTPSDDARLGRPMPGWKPCAKPTRTPMLGHFCRVEPLDPGRHTADLWAANAHDTAGRNWDYLGVGPFATEAAYTAWVREAAAGVDPMFHAIVDLATGKAVGVASFMRMDPANGVIEVGHINYSPLLQRKPAATEAMYLMMARAFDELGYRRYEWKCNDLNLPSKRAAVRLGFTVEGLFRQHIVIKGRNRDTRWYSLLDSEWPTRKRAFRAWLDPSNFDAQGQQKRPLSHT